MSYSDEDMLQLSGIQHFAYCRRQWALIHIEQQWAENLLTVEGHLMHENAHDTYSSEKRGDVIISRGMPVFSYDLGITGVCDIVEFQKADDGAVLFGRSGKYRVIPVEYKHGEPKSATDADLLQATAQAMCLEDMLCCTINESHIFYGRTKRRFKFEITEELRDKVKSSLKEMHELYTKQYTPKVKYHKGCGACSIKDICLPQISKKLSAHKYIEKQLTEI